MGAAGREFHDVIVRYRDDLDAMVVAFRLQKIPGVSGRRFPAALAGARYTDGIPIEGKSMLETVCRRERVTDLAAWAS